MTDAAPPDGFRHNAVIADRETEFAQRWRAVLDGRTAGTIRVVEFACGSANDYRAFDEYGLARFLDYRGIDVSKKNVANARRRFPEVAFEVGNILELPYPDASCDYVVAFDIFEHLSLTALERALAEATRLATRGVVLNFFNMDDGPRHEEIPSRRYYRNRLSAPQLVEALRPRYPDVRVAPISALMKERFGYPDSYNKHAYTIIAERP